MTQERKAQFSIGDIVQLNAGGPDMAIKQLDPVHNNKLESFKGMYRCQWFAGKKLDFGDFPEESLILIRKQGTTPDASE